MESTKVPGYSSRLDELASGGVPLDTGDYPSTFSGTRRKPKFPRLSRPVPIMRPEYDVVVVGSGYGGGVAASRMARAGKRVVVLELGKEKWPGEYPTGLKDSLPEFHMSGNAGRFSGGPLEEVAVGRSTGLYHVVVGQGQNAFVANGLGGTSLLNSNVFLRADKRTLQLNNWPEEIRNDPACLDPYYARAAEMLQPVPYPEDYPALKKLEVLEKQAKALGHGDNCYRVPQTTFFRDGLNNAGVEMKASTGSGQDCTGVNDGSKNSVLMNYLPDAWNWGAEIFCECEVRYIHENRTGGGYIVFYAWHGDGRKAFSDNFYNGLMWVRAKELCFLDAGALGTTEILLRSKAHGLKMSRFVGQKLSGDGDSLSFGYDTDEVVNGIGGGHSPAERPCGPTITGVMDNRGPETSPNVLDGYVLEEGAIPQALASVIQGAFESGVFGPYARGGSLNCTQTYLIMSHDNNEGTITLDNDKPYLRFSGVGRADHLEKLDLILGNATKAIGGTLINPPFYAITVHPLGGAIISSDETGRSGATNHIGQLFTGDGSEVHTGLVCVDGSVIPCALGVNPLATITALAERSVDFIARNNGWTIDPSKNGRLDLFGKPARSFPLTADMVAASKAIHSTRPSEGGGIRFTEIMDGHMHIGAGVDDFVVAENIAKGAASFTKLYLSVDVHNVKNLIERPDHASLATGTFSCAALSKDPMLILRGEVQFFTVDDTVSNANNLVYKLTLLSTDGEMYLMNGRKNIDSNMAFSVSNTWKATTTLYTTITRLDGSAVGRGILRVSWRNFRSQLKTLGPMPSGPPSSEPASSGGLVGGLINSILPFLGFFLYFAWNLVTYFLGPLSQLEYPDRTHSGYLPKAPPAQIITLTAKDGIQTTMKIWVPEDDVVKKPLPILMIPGASVDDQIFSCPTVRTNTVEYFTSRGYTVYVPVLRFGRVPVAEKGYTAFDARLDIAAAMAHVHEKHQVRMHVIAHCVGSIATSMGLLDGTLPAEWIQGLTVSQVFFKLHFGFVNQLKAKGPLGGGPWFPMNSMPNDTFLQRFLDQVLRFYPVGPSSELCTSTTCHRCSLVFGRLWNHRNLNHATHKHIINWVGGIHINMLGHLMRTGIAGDSLDNAGNNLVTDANLARLEGLPILFSTGKAYEVLRGRFGTAPYRRVVVAGYGHLDTWMGKRSNIDVYPSVRDHFERCEAWPRV
ncbi:hypothetical protein B0H17DRAFT_1247859 [Mycena rosella]|uniref:FAD/NAD(P)-binding domain-containing protein n=1 Tax=Mycena rosella TaxID=1033263 RepID=A0AAD7CXP1_MYCRO|nr:hypothetical protein B0H17DRAFT_1247859 [Mycena rosella]